MDINFKTYQDALDAFTENPSFTYAALQALRLAPDSQARTRLKAVIAASIGSETDLREILGVNSESLADFYADELAPHLSTSDTIDTFLNRFGSGPVTITPAADYAASPMELPEQAPVGDLIPDFNPASSHPKPTSGTSRPAHRDELTATPPGSGRNAADGSTEKAVREAEKESDSPALTESFAKILIKNHNYSKALEIIQDIYLKNPEKSIYFADQIRFLKKLIINSNKAGN